MTREREYRLANMIVAIFYTTILTLLYYYANPAVAVICFVYFIFLNIGYLALYINNKLEMKD